MKSTLKLATKQNPEPEHFDPRTGGEPALAPNAEPEQGCRCDRWGHPCPNCRHQTRWAAPVAPVFPEATTKR